MKFGHGTQIRFWIVDPAVLPVNQELVCFPLVVIRGLNRPEKEGTDRVAAQNRVEQLHDLRRVPDELPLNRREVVVRVQPCDGVCDRFSLVAHLDSLARNVVPLIGSVRLVGELGRKPSLPNQGSDIELSDMPWFAPDVMCDLVRLKGLPSAKVQDCLLDLIGRSLLPKLSTTS